MNIRYTPEQRALMLEWEKRLEAEQLSEKLPPTGEVLWEDPTDLALAEELDKQGKETRFQKFGGSPESLRMLEQQLLVIRDELLEEHPKEALFLLRHISCITDCDCVMIGVRGGNVYHLNTRHISGYTSETIAEISTKIDIEVD